MKISRRTIVKGIGAGICSTTVTSVLANASRRKSLLSKDTAQDSLSVQIAHQWGDESIAAIIKNTSDHNTTITDINSVAAEYGRFNFAALTRNGPLTLAAGEEVHIPFTVMGTPVAPYGHFDNRLQKQLKKTLRISTDNRKTRVRTAMHPIIV